MSAKMKVHTIVILDDVHDGIATVQVINGTAMPRRCDRYKVSKELPYIRREKTLYFGVRIFHKPERNGNQWVLKIAPYYARQSHKQ